MSENGLTGFRQRLDPIDEEIARLLGERFEICREVAAYKSEHGIPMMQPERVAEVRARYLARGAEVDLPADFTADALRAADRRHLQARGRADGGGGRERRGGTRHERALPPGPAHLRARCSRRAGRSEPLPFLEQCQGALRRHLHPAPPPPRHLGPALPTPRTSNGSSPPTRTSSASACRTCCCGRCSAPHSVMLLRGARAHGPPQADAAAPSTASGCARTPR